MTNVAVIIPYFQKKPGILRRALNSVLSQKLPPDVNLNIVVVDDGSPSPIDAEIEALAFKAPFSLIVIRQPNGGCAIARNSGLEHLDSATEYTAFLDSDDFWNPLHIAKAVDVLAKGYDFYFTDHSRLDHHASLFADIKFPPTDAPAEALKKIGPALWDIDKHFFFHHFLRVFTAHISSFAYRRAVFPDARFNDSLRTAGEDYLFMLQILTRSNRVCFTTEPMITCGDGVNIYYGTYSWDSEGHLLRIMGDILSLYELQAALNLSSEDASFIVRKTTMCRRRFAFFTLRRLLKYRVLWSPELARLTRADPDLWRWLPLCALYVTLMFPLRLYSPLKDVTG